MMTRKHYRQFAAIAKDTITKARSLHAVIPNEIQAPINHMIEGMADLFEQDNPNFNRDKFFEAIYK